MTIDAGDGEGPQPFDIFLDVPTNLELEFDLAPAWTRSRQPLVPHGHDVRRPDA